MQWSFSNQVSASPLLSFHSTQEEALPRRSIHGVLGSSGHTAASTSDKIEACYMPNNGLIRVGNHYPVRAHPHHHFHPYANAQTQAGRTFTTSGRSNPNNFLTGSSFCTARHLASTGLDFNGAARLNFCDSPISSQPLGVPSLSLSSDADATNQSSAPKCAQMTIFYNGTVNVYDDISPEKAQAIVLLAGDGSSRNKDKTLATAQVHESTSKPFLLEDLKQNQLQPASSFTCLPNPMISVPSAGQQSGGASRKIEFSTYKTVGVVTCPNKQPEPNRAAICSLASLPEHRTGGSGSLMDVAPFNTPRTVASPSNLPGPLGLSNSVASASKEVRPGGGLPLARKASLARFLERRKDRLKIASPDSINMNSPECAAHGSESTSLSLNSTMSCPSSNCEDLTAK